MPNTLPKLSIVVICFNMRREAERTLYTLSAAYQRDISEQEYEVIVIDNNSSKPLSKENVELFGENFRYHFYETNSVSPAAAVNYGAEIAKGEFVACIVDGARMVSPGKLRKALDACVKFPQPFIYSLAWHLGPKNQNESMLDGYNQEVEDKLLESIDWQNDGYKLFDVSTIAQSSQDALQGQLPPECSFFVMQKAKFKQIGGYDERFQSPGGGLVNHDFLCRAVKTEDFDFIVLKDEGTFHQFHGGVATNVKMKDHPWPHFDVEYKSIHERRYMASVQPKIISYE